MSYIRAKFYTASILLVGHLMIASGCMDITTVRVSDSNSYTDQDYIQIQGSKSFIYLVFGFVMDESNIFAVDNRVVGYANSNLNYMQRYHMNYTTEIPPGEHTLYILSRRAGGIAGPLGGAQTVCKVCEISTRIISGSTYKIVTDGVAVPFKDDVAKLQNLEDSSVIGTCKLNEIQCHSLDIEYYLLGKKGDSGPIGAQAQIP